MQLDKNIDAITGFTRRYLLDQGTRAFSEHTLLKALSDAKLFDNLHANDTALLLFQKHFLCMHVLYLLQEEFLDDNLLLTINPLAIYLEQQKRDSERGSQISINNELRAYYMDLSILAQATSESVQDLHQTFLKKYAAWASADKAYDVLNLDNTASWPEIQVQYRRLINSAHPDKGGDSAQFHRIKEAYNQLKLRHSS